MIVDELLSCLEKTPVILREMIDSIPREPLWRLTERRIEGKWSIHEHACHIVKVQPMLTDRARKFIEEEAPKFVPYFPGKSTPPDELLKMNLAETLEKFSALRKEFIDVIRSAPAETWKKKAVHPEYLEYTLLIMVRHVLLHDHVHMYRMEELWLTREMKK